VVERARAPLDLADVIAAAWNACVRHWTLLVRLSLLAALVTTAINLAVVRMGPPAPAGEEVTREEVETLLADLTPYMLLALVVALFTHLALVRASLDILTGGEARFGESYGAGLRALPVALVSLLTAVVLFSLLTAIVTVLMALLPPFGLLIPVLALYLFICWLFTPQAIVGERRGPFAALRRSRALVQGQWWRTCLVGLSVTVLYLFPGIVFPAIGARFDSEVAASAGAGLASLVAAPFLAMGHTVLYLDIRLRKGEPLRPAPPPERAVL
jgi:hypothetical protein